MAIDVLDMEWSSLPEVAHNIHVIVLVRFVSFSPLYSVILYLTLGL